MLKQLLEVLKHFVPAEVLLEGSGFVAITAVLIVVLAIVSLIWRAFGDAFVAMVKKWLGEDPRSLTRILILGLPVFAAAAVFRPVTTVVMAILAIVIMLVQRRAKLQLRVRGVAVIVLMAFLTSLAIEGWFVERRHRREAERFTVYVVLPFKPYHATDPQVRLNLSKSLLTAIGGIFGSLADVKIEPASFSVQDIDDWNDIPLAFRRLQDRGVRPDVMLVNLGTLTDDPGRSQILNLLLWPTFAVGDRQRPTLQRQREIGGTGRLPDVEYLAIRASLELVAQLKKLPGKPLSAKAEAEIVRNAVSAYRDQLHADGACTVTAACDHAEAALQEKALPLDRARALLCSYPPDEARRLTEIIGARAAATAGKVRPAAPSPEEGVTEQPAATTAPAAQPPAPGVKS